MFFTVFFLSLSLSIIVRLSHHPKQFLSLNLSVSLSLSPSLSLHFLSFSPSVYPEIGTWNCPFLLPHLFAGSMHCCAPPPRGAHCIPPPPPSGNSTHSDALARLCCQRAHTQLSEREWSWRRAPICAFHCSTVPLFHVWL